MKKIIVMYAGYQEWGSYKVFDSMPGVLKHFQEDWDMPELTLHEIKDSGWQKKVEINIVEAKYYPDRDDNPEIEQKCWAVRQSVNKKSLSLNEALNLYGVTIDDYRNYIDANDTN